MRDGRNELLARYKAEEQWERRIRRARTRRVGNLIQFPKQMGPVIRITARGLPCEQESLHVRTAVSGYRLF
jgi:hypothetical protein